jgi:hypothetical protein
MSTHVGRFRPFLTAALAAAATALAGCAAPASTATVSAATPSSATGSSATGSSATGSSATGSSTTPSSAPAQSTTAPATGPVGAAGQGAAQSGSPGRPSAAGAAVGLGSLVPLWPFTSLAQVRAWQVAFRTGGHQPWHLDPGATALSFARDHLGYRDVDRVTSRVVRGADARIGVGWNDAGAAGTTVAVVHLVRYGTGPDAPWVVVGTFDSRLTLDRPRYGSVVGSPLVVGGRVTGVDENLRVLVLGPTSATPLAASAGLPAGGERTPWSTTLRFRAPPGTVLLIAVSTGGHRAAVEAFAITAARAA